MVAAGNKREGKKKKGESGLFLLSDAQKEKRGNRICRFLFNEREGRKKKKDRISCLLVNSAARLYVKRKNPMDLGRLKRGGGEGGRRRASVTLLLLPPRGKRKRRRCLEGRRKKGKKKGHYHPLSFYPLVSQRERGGRKEVSAHSKGMLTEKGKRKRRGKGSGPPLFLRSPEPPSRKKEKREEEDVSFSSRRLKKEGGRGGKGVSSQHPPN